MISLDELAQAKKPMGRTRLGSTIFWDELDMNREQQQVKETIRNKQLERRKSQMASSYSSSPKMLNDNDFEELESNEFSDKDYSDEGNESGL